MRNIVSGVYILSIATPLAQNSYLPCRCFHLWLSSKHNTDVRYLSTVTAIDNHIPRLESIVPRHFMVPILFKDQWYMLRVHPRPSARKDQANTIVRCANRPQPSIWALMSPKVDCRPEAVRWPFETPLVRNGRAPLGC